MINVYYWPRELRMVMEGHAEHKGDWSPVVCGAASLLFETLQVTSNALLQKKWIKGRYHLNREGLGYLRIWNKRRWFKQARIAIGMCISGMMMLEEKYENLVRVNVCTGIPFDDEKVIEEDQSGAVLFLKKFCYDIRKESPADQKGQEEIENEK